MLTCHTDKKCPNGWECDASKGERCYAATGCDRPLLELRSNMLTTLRGPDQEMTGQDTDIFQDVVYQQIAEKAEELGVGLGGVMVGGQTLITRRQLKKRMRDRALLGHETYLNIDIQNITQRKLPSGSSAVDVSMVITGDYRPPPYVDLDVVAEDCEYVERSGGKGG